MFSNHPVRSHEKPYNRDKIAQNCTPFCRIRAILYAAAIFTCILTAEGKPSSPKDDTSAEK